MSQMKYLAGLLILLSSFATARTLTLTANSYTVHQGDSVPPCTFTAADSSGPYVWGNAVASGYPACSTTYTPTSSRGTYPYTIAVGTMTPQSGYGFVFVPEQSPLSRQLELGSRIQLSRFSRWA